MESQVAWQPNASVVVEATMQEARSPLYRRNMTPDKRSSTSVVCRICHEDSNIEELIDPCECAGTLGLIHASCLEKWLSTSNTDQCEICKYSFMIQKRNKPLSQSFYEWWRSSNIYGPQGIAGDVACLIVLTPLCIAATYLCGIGAAAYTRLGFWEGTGLGILCCMLVVTYCLWLFVTVRFHYKSWQQWCTKHQDVKLMVKHKSQEAAKASNCWIRNQDRNNNNNNNNAQSDNRFTTWFVSSFTTNGEPLCCQPDQATVV